MIQVRLDDDAEALVRANKEAHGGSLSKAANRLLRASASKPPMVARVVVDSSGTMGSGAGGGGYRGPASEAVTTVRTGDLVLSSPPKRVGRCSHPLLRRIGSACAACGATIG